MQSREIKFRAWHYNVMLDKYEMRLFEAIENNCGAYFFHAERYQPNAHILMQYTGLKDINGVEIYEGDILYDEQHEEIEIVNFKNGQFCTDGYSCDDLSDLRKIGTIYENPELLEEDNAE